MKPFENRTENGNEKSVKRGKVVPKDGINLAWAKSPKMTPSKNVVMLDTSQIVEENTIKDTGGRKIYYANSIGVLEDRFGNQLVEDEYPVVSDVFLQEEDFSLVPAEEYEDNEILPFVHKSRYFHIDHAGLTLQNDMVTYEPSSISVVDGKGQDYVDEAGARRYKIKIYSAYNHSTSDQGAYRLHVFVDDDTNEDLHLVYNKIEINNAGQFFGNVLNFKELLNPLPYFDYCPEESEVVDISNRDKKIFSTRPTSLKEQILGTPAGSKEGFKVYVPKKAIGDPREFQLFRWRTSCNFIQQYKVDPSSPEGVRCGVITTKSAKGASRTPYVFLNLERSQFNATGMKFYNPLSADLADETVSEADREKASYWYVDMDTVSYDDLKKFDILVWAPNESMLNLAPYAGKIDFFTRQAGGTLFMDTNNRTYVYGMGLDVTIPVSSKDGKQILQAKPPASKGWAYVRAKEVNSHHELFEGALAYGGWNFNDDIRTGRQNSSNLILQQQFQDEYETLSYMSSVFQWTDGAKTHYIKNAPEGWEPMYRMRSQLDAPYNARFVTGIMTRTLRKVPPKIQPGRLKEWENQYAANRQHPADPAGHFIFSSIAILETCNALIDNNSRKIINPNVGSTLARYDDYRLYINSALVEGAYKFLFNASLVAVKNKPLNNADEKTYSTSFSVSSNWKSSWVIDGEALSESERDKNDFALLPTDSATPAPVWQRKLSNQTLQQIIEAQLTPDMKAKVVGARREYFIEVTNSNVITPDDVGPNSAPYAWTTEYTPLFTVPVELGPHVIRDEEIKADYEAGQFIYKSYPAKPYNAKVKIAFTDTKELATVEQVNWTVHGTATETITTGIYQAPKKTTTESEVQLSWAQEGSKTFFPSNLPWEKGQKVPLGVESWQNHNYHTSAWGTGSRNWPSYLYAKLGLGSRGEIVTFVQDAMNVFQFYGFFHYKKLDLDGYYGSETSACVLAFQNAYGAHYKDGVVDAETLYIIGTQIIRLGDLIYKNRANSGWSRFYFWPRQKILKQSISDENNGTLYSKRSWISGGPSIIWDLFMITFAQKYDIHGVTFIPFVEGDTPTVMFRSIDVRNQPFNLTNYDSRRGNPIWMPYRPRDGQSIYVPFAPRRGDTLIVGVGQDGSSGIGSSRMLGIRDVRAHARVKTTTTIPGVDTIKKQTSTRTIESHGTSFVPESSPLIINIPKPAPSGRGVVLNKFEWKSVTTDNPNVVAKIVKDKTGYHLELSNLITQTVTQSNVSPGPKFPDDFNKPNATPYFYLNPDSKKVSKIRETGWISKSDGVKVLCDAAGKPVGFPNSIPNIAASANEQQRHFSNLRIESIGNDASVQVSFYDLKAKEFITNVQGEPEMPLIEYLKRGRDNVYVAAVSTYEVETQQPLPFDDTAPLIPYKWAMPVYGLYRRTGSKIGIDKLPKNLGQDDVWPIAIKTGVFTKRQYIQTRETGALSGWLGHYQGTTVTSHYSVPEADRADWSKLWGPPYADVKGEQPDIIDDDIIRVNQAPILGRNVPSSNPSYADPMLPVFKVWHRDSLEADWEALEPSEIRDYNLSTGEIYLKTKMIDSDPALWRVDYTTDRKNFFFKGTFADSVNLNPYSNFSKKYLREAVYVYIVPQSVRDENNNLIPDSVQDSTIKITFSSSVFDPYSPDYNPLAVQLGVVYLSTALDISELVILDSRKRGGGARAEANLEEIKRLAQDAASFWDIDHNNTMSYQKAGFVIVRLPEELKEIFTESEITKVIERNITSGVKFKVEDLSGKDWS